MQDLMKELEMEVNKAKKKEIAGKNVQLDPTVTVQKNKQKAKQDDIEAMLNAL